MKKLYFESRLLIDGSDWKKIKAKLELCDRLGIINLILDPQNLYGKTRDQIKERIKREYNFNIYYRRSIKVNNLREFKKQIKKYHRYPEIVSVESINKKVQLKASKDSRIDIVSFSDQKILKSLTEGVVSLVDQNNSFLEFSLEPIMRKSWREQSRNLRNLYKKLNLARNGTDNIIISGNFRNRFHLKNPRGLISICHTLLELPLVIAKDCFRKNVYNLIKRVKKRCNETIMENGIKIIRE